MIQEYEGNELEWTDKAKLGKAAHSAVGQAYKLYSKLPHA